MFIQRVSPDLAKSTSPKSHSNFARPCEDTISKDLPMGLTTGNFKSIIFSNEALERAKKLLESPESSQSKVQPCQFKTGANANCEISAEALSRAQKLFDSPSQGGREEKEKATEEIDKRPIKKGMPIGVRAGIIKHNRGELSCNSSIQPKFFSRVLVNVDKRRADSPQFPMKTLQKIGNFEESSLVQLNNNKDLKGFFNSSGLLVTADNAESYVFFCNCYSGGCGCSSKGMAWEDFYYTLVGEGFKCSKEWVQHHYRMVVWKYASYERRILACKGLFTVGKVLENLRKRFEIEVNQYHRSILKKIIDGDEMPGKRMVLCIGTVKNFGNKYEVELTDGWYSCWTCINDENLFFPLLQRKIISQGLKIEVVACALSEGKLVMTYNSTRRAAWNRKLGEVQSIFPFPVSISSIKEAGGIIGRITGYISRVYPLLYLEGNTLKKQPTSSDPGSAFFDCLIRDGLADHTSKKVGTSLVKVKHSATEIFENLKLGGLVNFYYTSPVKSANSKKKLLFDHKSRVTYGKKERKDLVKIRKIVDARCKLMKEVDVVGIVISVQKTQNNEVMSIGLAGVHGNIKVTVHNPSLFGRSLGMTEASTLQYMKIVSFLNVQVTMQKSSIVEVKTSNYSEIIHSNFSSHLMQQIVLLKEYNLNSLLCHRPECDHYGCVCGLE